MHHKRGLLRFLFKERGEGGCDRAGRCKENVSPWCSVDNPHILELEGHGGASRLHGGGAGAVGLERGEAHLEAEAVVGAGRLHGGGHARDGGALDRLEGGIVALEGGLWSRRGNREERKD